MTLTMTKTGAKVCDIITSLALVAYSVVLGLFYTQASGIGLAVTGSVLAGVILISYMCRTFYKHNFIVDIICISATMVLFVIPFTQVLIHMV